MPASLTSSQVRPLLLVLLVQALEYKGFSRTYRPKCFQGPGRRLNHVEPREGVGSLAGRGLPAEWPANISIKALFCLRRNASVI